MTDSSQRYVTQKKLGAGAMGEVYLATDTLLNRPVALKYLLSSQDADYDESFLAEARMLASLNHPHITAIHDAMFDEDKLAYCLVMEYVEGKPLSYLIDNWSGPLPLEHILTFALSILQALRYAHEKGIVHRDIKPDNVIVQKETAKLTDFGVAGLISLLSQGTEYMAGTPAYMSPEQIEGAPIDGRADLYALGVMLFKMASGGEMPYTFDNLDGLLDAHLEQPPLSLRDFAPDVPVALERIIMRLLAKKPDHRYPSAEAVMNALHTVQLRYKYSQSYLDLLDPNARPLAGRAEPLAKMGGVWDNVRQSTRPKLLMVQGEPGIGKTKLVTEFLGQQVVDAGFAALVGHCNQSGVPYAPYADILATIIEKQLPMDPIPQEDIDRLLQQIPSLGRLLNIAPQPTAKKETDEQTLLPGSSGLWKVLNDRLPDNTSDEPGQSEWQFFETVLSILNNLGPAAIFLENATQLDEASATLTGFLLQQEQLPLLLLAACRPTAEPVPWLDTFSGDNYEIIPMTPLAAEAIDECVKNLLDGSPPPAATAWIAERSRGNPLHVEEITFQLIESNQLRQENGQWRYTPVQTVDTPADAFLPRAVMGAFTRQIEKLSKNSRQALALAALLEPGPEFDFDLWLAALGGEDKQAAAQEIIDEALKKRVLREVGKSSSEHSRYAFRPPDLTKALAATLSQARRQEIHQQIARILHQQQGDPILMSHHYQKAGATADAVYQLERAGNKAIAANAFDTAIVYYRQASKLMETRSAYKALGHLYRLKGRKIDSVEAFEQALALAEQSGVRADQAQILNGLAQTLWLFDDYAPAAERATTALKLDGAPEKEQITAQVHLGTIAWLTGRLNEAETWLQKALAAFKKDNKNPARLSARQRLGQVYLSQGNLPAAQQTFQQTLALAEESNNLREQAQALLGLARAAIEQGQFDQAEQFIETAETHTQTLRSREGLMNIYIQRGRLHLYRQEPDQAMVWFKKALPPALERGQRNVYILSDVYRLMAEACLALNRPQQAEAAANDALKLVKAVGNQEFVALAQGTLAQTQVASGNFEKAEQIFTQSLALLEETGCRLGKIRTQLRYAQFLQGQGRDDRADALGANAQREAQEIELHLGPSQGRHLFSRA